MIASVLKFLKSFLKYFIIFLELLEMIVTKQNV